MPAKCHSGECVPVIVINKPELVESKPLYLRSFVVWLKCHTEEVHERNTEPWRSQHLATTSGLVNSWGRVVAPTQSSNPRRRLIDMADVVLVRRIYRAPQRRTTLHGDILVSTNFGRTSTAEWHSPMTSGPRLRGDEILMTEIDNRKGETKAMEEEHRY